MPINILPIPPILTLGLPTGSIMDFVPMLNIPSFIICRSPLNPATMPTMILTGNPMGPCIPMTIMPWFPAPYTVQIGGFPALVNTAKTMCIWAGMVMVAVPLALTVSVK